MNGQADDIFIRGQACASGRYNFWRLEWQTQQWPCRLNCLSEDLERMHDAQGIYFHSGPGCKDTKK